MKSRKIQSIQINFFLILISSAYLGISISFGDIYLFHISLILLFITTFIKLRNNSYKIRIDILNKKYIPTFLFFFIWYLISLFWTIDILLGMKYIFYIFCGMMILFSVVKYASTIKRFDNVFRVLGIIVLIEIIFALLESFTSFRLPISSYSSHAVLFGKEPVNYSKFDNLLSLSKLTPPTGFNWNTNDFAIRMVIVLPFFLCSKRVGLKIFGILCITTLIVMTASRAAFIALILIFTLYLVLIKKNIPTLILIWFSSIGLFFSIAQLQESSNPRINELANSAEALGLYFSGNIDVGGSLKWRRELIENGLHAFGETYGIGLGAGGSAANQEFVGAVDGRFISMHNFWIEILVEGGLLILVCLIIWYSGIISKLFFISKNKKNSKIKYYCESLFLAMLGFVPAAIAASSTIYFFPMWIMIGLSIAIIQIFYNQKDVLSEPPLQ